MPIFKYTDHVILWTMMSTQGQALIEAYDKLHTLPQIIYSMKDEILTYMGYEEADKPLANSFIAEYIANKCSDKIPTLMFDKDDKGESLYTKFTAAIKQRDIEKIKQSCLAIARAELREDIAWE